MGLIQTAIMTGGGIYAVSKLAKTAENRHSTQYNNNSGTYNQQPRQNPPPMPQYTQQYMQQPQYSGSYYPPYQGRSLQQSQDYLPVDRSMDEQSVAREQSMASWERYSPPQQLLQQEQTWYPANPPPQQYLGYAPAPQTPPPYAQQEYYGKQEAGRNGNGVQNTVLDLAGQFMGNKHKGKK